MNKKIKIIIAIVVILVLALILGLGLGLGLRNNQSNISSSNSDNSNTNPVPSEPYTSPAPSPIYGNMVLSSSVTNSTNLSNNLFRSGVQGTILNSDSNSDPIANTKICFEISNPDILKTVLVQMNTDVIRYIQNYFNVSDNCSSLVNATTGIMNKDLSTCSDTFVSATNLYQGDTSGSVMNCTFSSKDTSNKYISNKTMLDIGYYIYSYYDNPNYATYIAYDIINGQAYVISIYVIDVSKLTPQIVSVNNNVNTIICSSLDNLNIVNGFCA